MAAEGVYVEFQRQSELVRDGLLRQIDRQLVALVGGGPGEQVLHRRFVNLDGQHAVLKAVVEEDIGEARGDQDAEPVVFQCPGSMFPAGTAPEIAPGQQNACAGVFRPVQLERGVIRPVVQESPIEKQKLAEARPLDALQELLWDDLIGIDIRPIHRNDQTGVGCERTHK